VTIVTDCLLPSVLVNKDDYIQHNQSCYVTIRSIRTVQPLAVSCETARNSRSLVHCGVFEHCTRSHAIQQPMQQHVHAVAWSLSSGSAMAVSCVPVITSDGYAGEIEDESTGL